MDTINNRILLELAGLTVQLTVYYQRTIYYLRKYSGHRLCLDPARSGFDISLPPVDREQLRLESLRFGGNNAFAEYSLLLGSLSNPILHFDRFFFHGAAFCWRGAAVIFTGKSGIGKTTMLRHWIEQYSHEIEIINGDKPVIEYKNGEFIVYPSPWTGKEGWSGTVTAKLAGIVLLEQGQVNSISRMDKQSAVFPMFLQFLYKPVDESSVDLVCQYEQAMLEHLPVWQFVNNGTFEAAQVAHKILEKEIFI